MTRERRDRIEEIAKDIKKLRNELLNMRSDEIRELPSITDRSRYSSSREHIKVIGKATVLFSDGIRELGY